jgi:hypothetical protein
VRLKIHGFSWPWVFLVSRRLRGQPILGADFISKTKLILELGSTKCRFDFAPSVCIIFIQGRTPPSRLQYVSLTSQAPQVQKGKLFHSQQRRLERLISHIPDVLNEKVGLTHVLEYEMQLLDNTPVRLAPYRLAPPKMQYLHEHIQGFSNRGSLNPHFGIILALCF